ncbi:hypothetical protein FRC07_005604, partial [Ceratobasidium sp. 392]
MPSTPRKQNVFSRLLEAPSRAFDRWFRPSASTPASSGANFGAGGSPAVPTTQPTPAGLKFSLKLLRASAHTIPGLKSAADALTECFDNIPAAAQNRQDYLDLATNITVLVQSLDEHAKLLEPTQVTRAVETAIEQLSQQLEYISQKQKRTGTRQFLDAAEDIDDLVRCYSRVRGLLQRLQVSQTTLFGTKDLDMGVEQRDPEHLGNDEQESKCSQPAFDELLPVQAARYDSSAASQVGRTGCTLNTRRLVLAELRDWASDPSGAKVYWMNGMAGTGKTTIAYSLCSQLELAHQLAASFFCSRSLPDCRDVTRIVPTVAYQLARFHQPFQDALCETLARDPDAGSRGVTRQFEKLISEPMGRVHNQTPTGLLVVVIDALDECTDVADALLILNTLLQFAKDLPLKFFVTCRPEHSLLDAVEKYGSMDRSLYHLHDIEQSLVQADIETYLRAELKSVDASDEQIERLAKQSGKLFIYAATTLRYIMSKKASVDHQKRLHVVLAVGSTSSTKVHAPLDALYTAILAAALEDDELAPWETKNTSIVLHTVVCAKEPLPISALAYMLRVNSKRVGQALEPLRSVLHVDEQTKLVSTLHASFPDYMLAASRSTRFFCDEARQNKHLGQRCFETMRELLHFNICGLESSHVLDSDVLDLSERMSNSIPSHLFYACQYWSDHMLHSKETSEQLVLLAEFLHVFGLYWVEVMNLKQATRAGIEMLSSTYSWMKASSISDDLCSLCLDMQKFILVVGANAVSRSTPHIYVSILALWDKNTPMWRHYGTQTQKQIKAKGSAISNRESAAVAVWRNSNEVYAVSVSPDGKLVASGSEDGSMCIWDAHTGNVLVGPIVEHKKQVNCVTFSPDSSRFASCSHDCTVRLWDAYTGRQTIELLHGHTDAVWSVAFSPNGKYIISGSEDRTIRVWDATTGVNLASPFKLQETGASLRAKKQQKRYRNQGSADTRAGGILSLAYSPDGKQIVLGFEDQTIQIRDIQNGRLTVPALTGHTGRVWSVAYSPDGRHVASGCADGSICVWDAQNGKSLGLPFQGHTDEVRCVSYSSNGERIVSGSQDCTVRVWDTQTGQIAAGPFIGHTTEVYSVVFMPGDDRVLSCSDDGTIRIWDARAICAAPGSPEGHIGQVYSVAFSPDSNSILSGGQDRSLCIWDARSGKRIAGPFTGHTDDVNSVAFSPRGNLVASCSDDGTVRIWDVKTGKPIAGPLEGHDHEVNKVTFSPDGSQVASVSGDGTIRLWHAQSGQPAANPFKGHSVEVESVAYSPSGDRLASCDANGTIMVWNAKTGEVSAGPFKYASKFISWSNDDTRILFSSDDFAISVCDAITGTITIGPCKGHTDWVHSAVFTPDD